MQYNIHPLSSCQSRSPNQLFSRAFCQLFNSTHTGIDGILNNNWDLYGIDLDGDAPEKHENHDGVQEPETGFAL